MHIASEPMMRESKSKLLLPSLGAATLLLSLSSPSDASVSIAMTIEDLAKGSSVVVRATPLDQTSAWENGRIVTSTRMHVERVIAGAPPSSSEVHVQTLGGIVGDIGQIVDGEASFMSKPSNNVQQQSIIFLMPRTDGNKTHFVVNGRAQGQLVVLKDVKTNRDIVRLARTGALVPRVRTADQGQAAKPAMMGQFDGHDADEVSNEAARAWERTHHAR